MSWGNSVLIYSQFCFLILLSCRTARICILASMEVAEARYESQIVDQPLGFILRFQTTLSKKLNPQDAVKD
jgi:hypothetical protein